ncbi:MAG TPA: methionyl-tRNA formyltransferase, partial [Actinomycetota bacterium]|nr:methionyl-tRNA formyltransferase [Actinomycetota bacterium]
NPAPGAWSQLTGKRLKVFRVEAEATADLTPGAITAGRTLLVGTGDGPVALEEVQLEGKRRMSGAELARGLRIEPGTRLE